MATTTTMPFNMRSVTAMTGVNEHTLRAWESRYEAVRPKRSASGHRQYSQADVDRLRLLAQLVERGHAIGGIAALTDRALVARLAEAEHPGAEAADHGSFAGTAELVRDVVRAIRRFDLTEVQRVLQEGRFRFGARVFALGVVAALMAEVGLLVAADELSIAHEHALSAVVKAHLMELLFSGSTGRAGARIAFATMEGDLHEIGLMISAVLAAHHGFDIAYIGPNMPPAPLGEALRAMKTELLVLGMTELPPGVARWSSEVYVGEVARRLPRNHEIWAGGLPHRPLDLSSAGRPWKHLRSLHELDEKLARRAK